MPLNVRSIYTSVLLVFVGFISITRAQTVAQTPPQTSPQTVPTSGDVMRARISKAKAFIAVRNYNAAIYELENIRRESGDPAVQGVVNVLLMNSYLEQGDYKRAQDFLTEFYTAQKTTKPNASAWYMAVAGQVVKGARNRVERYRALGLSVTDRSLPLEATNDLEKMRETLELVITQSKEIGGNKAKTADSMALVEEAGNSRSMLARDDYDAHRWKDEVADTREKMANARSVVLSVVDETSTDKPNGDLVATNTKPTEKPIVITPPTDTKSNITREREVKPAENKPTDDKPSDITVANNDRPVYIPSSPPAVVKEDPKPQKETPKTETAKTDSPMDVGSSLIGYATKQVQPVYPPQARTMRTTGIVKVEFTVNETGDVAGVQKTSGPALLQGAAKDAIKKWKFKPFVRDGQPARATGYVSFNFAL